jgi:hypothetical protein
LPPSIRDFGTWAPLLALLWAGDQQGLSSPGGYLAGHVGRRGFGWSVGPGQQDPLSGGAVPVVLAQLGFDPMAWVQDALADAGMDGISFVAEFSKGGRAVLDLLEFGPAVEVTAGGIGLGSLVLVEGPFPSRGAACPPRYPVPGQPRRRTRRCWSGRFASGSPAPSALPRRRSPLPNPASASRSPAS